MTPWLIGYLFTIGFMVSGDKYKEETKAAKFFILLVLLISWPFALGVVTYEVIKKL